MLAEHSGCLFLFFFGSARAPYLDAVVKLFCAYHAYKAVVVVKVAIVLSVMFCFRIYTVGLCIDRMLSRWCCICHSSKKFIFRRF